MLTNIVPFKTATTAASANAPSSFDFKGHAVRVIEIEGEPWFVAKEVCEVLGLAHVSMATKPLLDNERRVVTPSTNRSIFAVGRGSSRLILVNESGLYKLVMRSDKPEARAFQDWVTRVVLPAIRKNGGYVMGQEKLATGEMREPEYSAEKCERLSNIMHSRASPRAPFAQPLRGRRTPLLAGLQVTSGEPDVAAHGRATGLDGACNIHNER